jgi:hypothetical protein
VVLGVLLVVCWCEYSAAVLAGCTTATVTLMQFEAHPEPQAGQTCDRRRRVANTDTASYSAVRYKHIHDHPVRCRLLGGDHNLAAPCTCETRICTPALPDSQRLVRSKSQGLRYTYAEQIYAGSAEFLSPANITLSGCLCPQGVGADPTGVLSALLLVGSRRTQQQRPWHWPPLYKA